MLDGRPLFSNHALTIDNYKVVKKRLLTFEELIERLSPVTEIALVAGLVPDEGALDVALGWHRSEAQTRVAADQGAVELPLGLLIVQRLIEYGEHAAEEGRQYRVEYHVEQQDLG